MDHVDVPGTDATVFMSDVASLGTASFYYGAQDKLVAAQLGLAVGGTPPPSSPRLAEITFVQDKFDSPCVKILSCTTKD